MSNIMVVGDLASIEFNIVGWLARCPAIREVIRLKKDAYLDFAVRLYAEQNLNYDDLKRRYDAKDPVVEELRQNSKPPVLGCGYGLGGSKLYTNQFGDTVRGGLWGYALNVCGVDMPRDLADKAVEIYRKSYPEVPQLWTDMEEAFKYALQTGKNISVGHVTFNKYTREWVPVAENTVGAYITFSRYDGIPALGSIIRMQLPSGRFLHYLNCRIEIEDYSYIDKKSGKEKTAEGEVIYYDGIEHSATLDEEGQTQKGKTRWGKTKTYGAKEVENVVQAVSRDILVNGAHLARGLGFSIFGLFHDETATEVKEGMGAPGLDDLLWSMSQPPVWAPTMILSAAGWTGKFYRKG